MDGLCSLVSEIFKAHGYSTTLEAALEGKSGTVYAAPILVEGEAYALIVERRGPDDVVTGDMVEELSRVVEDTGADQALIVYLGRKEANAEGMGAGRVVLWNQAQLTQLLGNAALIPLGVAPERLPLEASTPSAETEEEPLDFGLPTGFMEEVPDLGALAMETPGSTPDAAPAEHAPLDLHHLDSLQTGELDQATNYPVAPLVIEGMVAEARVKSQLYGAGRRELVLSPIHVFEYECDLLLEGSLNYDTIRGLLEVNASKEVAEVAPDFHPRRAGDLPPGITEVEERSIKINQERAQLLAHDFIMDAHTRIVDVETWDEESDVSMTERKKVSPRPDQVRLQFAGTIHRPYWRIVGPNGSSLVDAVTGDVVGSELRNYDPDVVMLD
ncbi:MAG: restriction endonuclease [Thermoplasmatota archaeon]